MLVRNWMSRDVVTIDINDSMQDATRLLKLHGISRLPVMKKGKLAGIVTDRGLKNDLKGKSTLLYVIDHRENKREIFEEEYRSTNHRLVASSKSI